MTPLQTFLCWLGALTLTACGLAGVIVITLGFFTYQGTGLDWIYPVSGLLLIACSASAYKVLSSGLYLIALARKRKRANLT